MCRVWKSIALGQTNWLMIKFGSQNLFSLTSFKSTTFQSQALEPHVMTLFSGLNVSISQFDKLLISSGVNIVSQSSTCARLPLRLCPGSNPGSHLESPKTAFASCSCPRTNEPPVCKGW